MSKDFSMDQAIRDAFNGFFQAYFVRKDLGAAQEYFSPAIVGFGPGRDAAGFTFAEIEKLCLLDLEKSDQALTYTLNNLHITAVAQDCGMVFADLAVAGDGEGNGLRISAVFRRRDRAWFLEGFHFSRPAAQGEQDLAAHVRKLEARNKTLRRQLKDKTAKLNEAVNEISILGTSDTLTGVFNRLKMDQILDSEVHRSRRYNNSFSLVLVDLDHFKEINEEHGRITGDHVLIGLARMLSGRVRKTDILGRWAGDQFLVVCQETGLKAGARLAEDLRREVEVFAMRHAGRLTASVGVATYADKDTRDTIVTRAYEALQEAQRKGGNQVAVHEPPL